MTATSAMIGLSDAAYLMNLSVHTLRHDWKDRVIARRLPAPHPDFKQPRWERGTFLNWLKNPNTLPPATASTYPPGSAGGKPARSCDRRGDSYLPTPNTSGRLSTLMTQNHGD